MIYKRWRIGLLAPLLLLGCMPRGPEPGTALVRTGDEISVCGYLFHTGARVVLWNDTGGYDAYRLHRRFDPGADEKGPTQNPDRLARYGSFRRGLPDAIRTRVEQSGWALSDLRKVVDRVVVHYDACGTSQRCFEVLHDIRGLSAHFLIDVDGTIYQTLDVKERAWHAGEWNDRSIGIEIAHIGAHPDRTVLDEWYVPDEDGRLRIDPEKLAPSHPTKEVHRPVDDTLHRGVINGHDLVQYDFTEPQYRALERLLVTLCRVLPAIPPTVPRDADGAIVPVVFGEDTPGREAGIIGHFHGSEEKVDPGPAFDWERIERALERVD